jgi:hypothetical protein
MLLYSFPCIFGSLFISACNTCGSPVEPCTGLKAVNDLKLGKDASSGSSARQILLGLVEVGEDEFVHILDLQDSGLFLPLKNNKVKRACEFVGRKAVKFTRVDGGIVLQLGQKPSDIDYVVELQF